MAMYQRSGNVHSALLALPTFFAVGGAFGSFSMIVLFQHKNDDMETIYVSNIIVVYHLWYTISCIARKDQIPSFDYNQDWATSG